MKFPKGQDLESIIDEIKDKEATLVIDFKSSSTADILKYQLCQEFVKILKDEDLKQVELARKLGVDKSTVNKIILHKVDSFTVDRLMDLLSSIRSLEVFLKAS